MSDQIDELTVPEMRRLLEVGLASGLSFYQGVCCLVLLEAQEVVSGEDVPLSASSAASLC